MGLIISKKQRKIMMEEVAGLEERHLLHKRALPETGDRGPCF